MIAITYRANLCNFSSAILDMSLELKRKRGAKKATKPCLQRQSIQTPQKFAGLEQVDDVQPCTSQSVVTKARKLPDNEQSHF